MAFSKLCNFYAQDPTSALLQLAENSGMSNRFHALSLGQGQAPIATRMIKEGVKDVSTTLHIFMISCMTVKAKEQYLPLVCRARLISLTLHFQVIEPKVPLLRFCRWF